MAAYAGMNNLLAAQCKCTDESIFKHMHKLPGAFFIAFIIIRLLNAFKYDFSIFNIICKRGENKRTQLKVIDRTPLHRLQIARFIYTLPVHHFAKLFFQQHVNQMRVARPLPSMKG